MPRPQFPTQHFVHMAVQLLDTIKYCDVNYTHEERVHNLHYAYSKAAQHFAQPHVRDILEIKSKKLETALQTITGMVVYCWIHAPLELMASLTIHYTYTLILDDTKNDPRQMMKDYFPDMMAGKPSVHPWFKLVNEHFPQVWEHYGPYCGLNIYRSTIDFFQGCWIEHHNFHGYEHSEDYPDFLRRLNGLGHAVGASIWPAALVDEELFFCEITTAIAMMENWMVWVNDLISFYKEYDNPHDESSLVNNYCVVGNLTIEQGLDKLVQNTLRVSKQIMSVFADKDPLIRNALNKVMHGYVTWHLCDKRYRISEIYDKTREDTIGVRFRSYYEEANRIGRVDPAEWAYRDVEPKTENDG